MHYASPVLQLFGVICSLLVSAALIFASILFLRDRHTGAWIMLAGGILEFIGIAVPQGVYALENFAASHPGAISDFAPKVEGLMYFSIWDWLSTFAWMLFACGLVLVALQRRRLSGRIRELENFLTVQPPPHQPRPPSGSGT